MRLDGGPSQSTVTLHVYKKRCQIRRFRGCESVRSSIFFACSNSFPSFTVPSHVCCSSDHIAFRIPTRSDTHIACEPQSRLETVLAYLSFTLTKYAFYKGPIFPWPRGGKFSCPLEIWLLFCFSFRRILLIH